MLRKLHNFITKNSTIKRMNNGKPLGITAKAKEVQPMGLSEILTAKEAAQLLRTTGQRVRQSIQRGR